MTSYDFNHDWTVGPQVSPFARLTQTTKPKQITLPHDALISEPRSADNPGKGAFFPSGGYAYNKTFDVPEEWRSKSVWLRFDGVYRDAMVFINDGFAAHQANGYAPFDVLASPFLVYGQSNSIRVEARTHDDSRWYAGAGIYRDVVLDVRELLHIVPGAIHVTTPDIDAERAVVEAVAPVANRTNETRTVRARLTIRDASGGVVASDDAPITIPAGGEAIVRLRAYVAVPNLWSVDDPYLYAAAIELREGDAVAFDEERVSLGIRALQLDPKRGLSINGESVKLRGACIHHDNGVLGTAVYADAELRKIRKLKEAGFNAIRSAHNIMSTAMLDACDEVGMLVMDEVYDVWTVQKSSFDSTISFAESWVKDIDAMVRRDRNHPSVILYSIGNEIPETGNRHGAGISRAMVDRIRALDPHRYTTNGVNGFVSVLDDVLKMMAMGVMGGGEDSAPSGGVNDVMASSADGMNQLNRSDLVTRRTEEAFATLDVAGLNYGDARYALDADLFPNRIIVGSETYPGRIATNWPLVLEHSHVLGDFTWVGWDYLGEVGIGRPRWEGEDLALEAEYPWLTAWTGDLDITGFRRPASFFREIVFGLRAEPYIAVRRPQNRHLRQLTGTWSWSDTVGSWAWDLEPGSPMTVEVYADGDEVELLLGDTSLGRQQAGVDAGYLARFDVAYAASDLTAVSYRDGVEAGRFTLHPAVGEPSLTVTPESQAARLATGSLIYVPIELTDTAGTLVTSVDRPVSIEISGPAELVGYGSARPDNVETYGQTRHTTFEGRLLAVLRPTGEGSVRIAASAEGLAPADATVAVTA
ncbi:hypothetical protein JOD63_000339 [Microbacterium terrae]|uniref:Beta-galactosidase n=1 Tax=Microbacterium terrae TaxID=69369 RepID=A0A0M2GV24_9MICO|nr:glycoside hydrolase family 2 TIM barrel-domain containing protein [Microbacterium terrae]KJL37541.1 Beta-galactosidase [Microbacterium terrae]MBP1076371.1 hypothetical protein [Microbacterium terrae]GLJ97195.1 beta-galactosidase [Microbacterium terrae]